MREITRYNYEEFFLDYLEGTLSSLQSVALEDFLTRNPDLKLELEEMECPVFTKDSVEIDLKSLKEIPFRESFDDFCIARLEGDLSVENEIAFDTFLEKNKSFQKENQIYQKTILHADNSLVFTDKEKLKRSSRKVAYWWYFSRIGVAASIVLLFSLWSILYQFKGNQSDEEKITAKVEKAITESKKTNKIKEAIDVEALVTPKREVVQSEKKYSIENRQQKTADNQGDKTQVENIEKVLKRVEPVVLSSDIKLIALANSADPTIELDIPKEKNTEISTQNNGLAQLGMSWKSSVPEKKAQNSVLYAIAKYGVDKLGEIAGKNVQLEKKYDSTTEKTRLDFNTAGIGFSKTIK
ncbi:hypothetical protein QUH73_11275 [Labilibaculum sp. K2S]|uniref:hypothetical protein n=1 Tax=Labilibaculum sp. K2S TaxID=3056386 RepID=UPI0025A45A3D|nr:hypothetical protein [Labilibaculum sp. K2S]MDM8160396.1 hypothetical protein [Labilibaculum sp. K2S]